MTNRTEPAWLTLFRAEIGVREAPGHANNPRVLAYYADAGHRGIRSDAIAWCAAVQCAVLERSGTASPKTLSARDFLRWGKEIDAPELGAIAVLWRDDPSSYKGHVGTVTGWTDDAVCLISGNMGDAVTEEWFTRSRVLGYRVPVTAESSRTVKAAKASAITGAVGAMAKATEQAIPVPDKLLELTDAGNQFVGVLSGASSVLPAVSLVASLLSIALAAVTLWVRLDDLAKKGR